MTMSPDQEILARVRRIEDREAIRELASRYGIAMDDRDMDLVSAIFASNAVLTWHGGTPRYEGRQAIVDFYTERLAPTGPSFHVMHDHLIQFEADSSDRASGLVLCHAETYSGGKQMVSAIRYQDSYVREGGSWRIAERMLSFLYQTPVANYPGILGVKERLLSTEPPRRAHWPVSKLTGDLV